MRFCQVVGAEPYLCVNMGTGSMDEAQAWVEYCNGTSNTEWARLRRENGHEEPYGVRYWGLGNEMYGPGRSVPCRLRTKSSRLVSSARS